MTENPGISVLYLQTKMWNNEGPTQNEVEQSKK
jgi:hypothetical protein